MDNIRRRIVGVMFPPSIFDFRRSMIDVSTFEDRCVASPFEDRCHDVSTFGDRCVDLRRSMCRPSEMDVLSKTDDRCVDLRRSVIDVPTFEHRWSM